MLKKILKFLKEYWRVILLGLLLILLLLSIYFYTRSLVNKNLTVKILNIGQGDSILIGLPDHEIF